MVTPSYRQSTAGLEIRRYDQQTTAVPCDNRTLSGQDDHRVIHLCRKAKFLYWTDWRTDIADYLDEKEKTSTAGKPERMGPAGQRRANWRCAGGSAGAVNAKGRQERRRSEGNRPTAPAAGAEGAVRAVQGRLYRKRSQPEPGQAQRVRRGAHRAA